MPRLIVVDGLDGCGKDTFARRIRELLEAQGEEVALVSHPSSRLFGRLSKAALTMSGHVPRVLASLFYTLDVLASVAWYRRRNEDTVIFVRYLLGTAYLPRVLAPPGYTFFRRLLPFPDLALFIDIDPAVAMRRIEQRDHRREMFETMEKLEEVRRIARVLTEQEWTVLDNSEDGEGPFLRLLDVLRSEGYVRTDGRVSADRP